MYTIQCHGISNCVFLCRLTSSWAGSANFMYSVYQWQFLHLICTVIIITNRMMHIPPSRIRIGFILFVQSGNGPLAIREAIDVKFTIII